MEEAVTRGVNEESNIIVSLCGMYTFFYRTFLDFLN